MGFIFNIFGRFGVCCSCWTLLFKMSCRERLGSCFIEQPLIWHQNLKANDNNSETSSVELISWLKWLSDNEGKGRGWGSELRGQWGLFPTFRRVWVCCSGLNSVMMLRFRASRFTSFSLPSYYQSTTTELNLQSGILKQSIQWLLIHHWEKYSLVSTLVRGSLEPHKNIVSIIIRM
jgi:hypothetical protein